MLNPPILMEVVPSLKFFVSRI